MTIGIIDYGVGNLGSIGRALEELRIDARFLDDPADADRVQKLLLPGVGSYTDCMEILHERGWVDALNEAVREKKKPLLGVCVGMQLLSDYGTEGAGAGRTPGLGFVGGTVSRLSEYGCNLRLPHIGWNEVRGTPAGAALFGNIPDGSDFYFVHSYAFRPSSPDFVAAVAFYGVEFATAVRNGHVWGTQFHPEKSSRAGFAILKNFARL